jgi:hypothetical protein
MITAYLLACTALFNCPVIIPLDDFKDNPACVRSAPTFFKQWKDVLPVEHGTKYDLRIVCRGNLLDLDDLEYANPGFDI